MYRILICKALSIERVSLYLVYTCEFGLLSCIYVCVGFYLVDMCVWDFILYICVSVGF